MLDPKEHGIKHTSRGRAHRCSSLGGWDEPPAVGRLLIGKGHHMEIKVQFTPTNDDYIDSLRVFSVTPWVSIIIVCIFIVMGIFFGITALDPSNLTSNKYWYSPYALQFIPLLLYWAILFFVPMLNRMEIRSQYESNEQLTNQVSWCLDDDQIITKTKISEMRLDWSVYSKVIEFGPYYLLLQSGNKRSLSFLPKRSFESPDQEMEFRKLVERKIGKIHDEYFKKKILPERIKVGGVIFLFIVMLGYWIAIYWKLLSLN